MKGGFIQLTLAGEENVDPMFVFIVPEKVEAIETATEGIEQGAKTTIICENSCTYNVTEPPELVMKLYAQAMWAARSMSNVQSKPIGWYADGPMP